jgi:isopenicillin N synthase-like dioxygenase
MEHAGIADALLSSRYARVQLSHAELDAIDVVRSAAAEFFARVEAGKLRHSGDDGLYGYRPYGMQFSDDPNLPDECESFAYWGDDRTLIPAHEEVVGLCGALSAYRAIAAAITAATLSQLAAHYCYRTELNFGPASYIEINSYGRPADRELLQTRHEDGHLISLVVPNKPGLEIEIDGQMRDAWSSGGEMLVMPGSVLTVMTGGEIQPLYHQVRNYRFDQRTAVLYFANTPMQPGTVEPYVRNDGNARTDVATLCRQSCTQFGKPLPRIFV